MFSRTSLAVLLSVAVLLAVSGCKEELPTKPEPQATPKIGAEVTEPQQAVKPNAEVASAVDTPPVEPVVDQKVATVQNEDPMPIVAKAAEAKAEAPALAFADKKPGGYISAIGTRGSEFPGAASNLAEGFRHIKDGEGRFGEGTLAVPDGALGSDYLDSDDSIAALVPAEVVGGPGSVALIPAPTGKIAAKEKRFKLGVGSGSRGGVGSQIDMIRRDPQAGTQPVKEVPGTEEYAKVAENQFKKAIEHPLSTFSIDVDTASYSNMRRFVDQMGRLPPRDSVRIEEFINYFTYDYPMPQGETPFAVTTEISFCPWNPDNRLALIGLQGTKPAEDKLPPSNLVFLIDSSGSMSSNSKMGLLKQGFKMLVNGLRNKDSVAIVTYAGSAGLVLPATPGTDKHAINAALDRLRAGGSTAGAAGIELAYKVALENFIKGGNNRIILASDGDFNVGPFSNAELERLIEEKRKAGVFLTILGFGMGNYKDSRMETLADKGNGSYAYIDDVLEAKKVFVTQMTGTLFTIAKDVKIQVEFNPTKVAEYRLVGYENRMLKKEDFADDTKDAGELGAGHTVTALYEIVIASKGGKGSEDLKYVKTTVKGGDAVSSELMTVKLRYKDPDGEKSKLIEQPVLDQGVELAKASDNFRWAAAVASFGQLVRGSAIEGKASFNDVLSLARGAKGEDRFGYRAEFIRLVEKADAVGFDSQEATSPPAASGRRRFKTKVSTGSVRGFVGGKIDKKAVNRYLRRRSSTFQRCYQAVARRNPAAKGKLSLRVKIDLRGRASAKVVSDKTGDPAIAKCVIAKIRSWVFPKPEGKAVEFKVPFVFRSI